MAITCELEILIANDVVTGVQFFKATLTPRQSGHTLNRTGDYQST